MILLEQILILPVDKEYLKQQKIDTVIIPRFYFNYTTMNSQILENIIYK